MVRQAMGGFALTMFISFKNCAVESRVHLQAAAVHDGGVVGRLFEQADGVGEGREVRV